MAETQARQISCSSQHKVKILPGAGEGDGEREDRTLETHGLISEV